MSRNASNTAFPDRLCEWLFASMMMAWGSWLLIPAWNTFDAPQYALLKSVASENVWGVWSISVGVVRCAALYINGSHRKTPIVRMACAWLGMMWWASLSVLFLSAPVVNPAAGFAWYPVFIAFEGVCVWRSAADAYHSRAFQKRGRVDVQ